MSLTFHPVDRHQVGKQWPRVRKWLTKACQRSRMAESMTSLRERCAADALAKLYLIRSDGELVGAVVMELAPRQHTSHIVAMGGDMPSDWVPDFFGWWRLLASVQNVRWLTLKGRKGWERVTARYGFTWNNGLLTFDRGVRHGR